MTTPGALPLPPADPMERLDRDEPAPAGPVRLAGCLLRGPGGILREVAASERLAELSLTFLALAAVVSAAYGAVLGLYQPGLQTLYAALKVPVVVVGSVLLCTPSLYVFNAVLGGRLALGQVLVLTLGMSACMSLILIAFAPIAWLFGVSTEGVGFLTMLHVAVFLTAAGFGLRFVAVARRYLARLWDGSEAVRPAVLAAWSGLMVVVGLQVAHYLRPLMMPGPFFTGERGLFIEALRSLW